MTKKKLKTAPVEVPLISKNLTADQIVNRSIDAAMLSKILITP